MENGGYQPVAFNGVHDAHSYKPPMAGHSTGGFKISSPSSKRKPLKGDRLIAGEIAGPTTSKSVFDLPDRKNVLQVDIPDSTTKNISYEYNAQRNTHAPNLKLTFHGTESVKRPTYHGKFIELEAKVKPINKKAAKKAKKAAKKAKKVAKKKLAKRVNNVDEKSFKKSKDEALKIAKNVEKTSGGLLTKVHVAPNKLVIPVQTTNKRENNNLKLKHKQV